MAKTFNSRRTFDAGALRARAARHGVNGQDRNVVVHVADLELVVVGPRPGWCRRVFITVIALG